MSSIHMHVVFRFRSITFLNMRICKSNYSIINGRYDIYEIIDTWYYHIIEIKGQIVSNIMTFLYEMNMLIIRIHNRGFEILHPSVHDDYLLLCFKYYTACFQKKTACIELHRQMFWSNLPYNIRGYNRKIFFWNFLISFLLLSYIIVKYAVPAIIKFGRGNGWSV